MQKPHHTLLTTLSLFSSFSTLICCALPALLVTVGLGATLAGIVSKAPQLVWLSEHKQALFIFSFCMLLLNGILRYHNRFAPCPTDKDQAASCSSLKRASGIIYYVSIAMFAIGFFFAYIAPTIIK